MNERRNMLIHLRECSSVYYRIRFFFGMLFLPFVVSAQSIPAESPVEILKQRQEVFRQINALENPFEDSLWYQGRIYEFELSSTIGTPYFLDKGTLKGNLTYKGKDYEELLLSYNLIMDDLIIEKKVNEYNIIKLVLNKYFVEGFTLQHYSNYYHFRLHTEMKPIHDQLKEGFYEVVYDDELMMLVRHNKVLFFDASKSDHYSYKDEKQVYLILAGKIYDVNSRRIYLQAFQNYKKSLRKYMRRANINFERSGTQTLSGLCAYSQSLLDQ
ncbi:hypothetical protein ACFLTU_09115 [Bacteroidota bacterium]